MKKTIIALCAALAASPAVMAETSITVFDHASYYDGYLVGNIPEDAPDEGYLRLFTYLNSTPLTDEILDQIGEHLTIDVTLHAFCDNYDRIASVNLAFIPKGQTSYSVAYDDETDPTRMEVARFITPFMNKNRTPSDVPYTFIVDNLSKVLRNKEIRRNYDIWMELEIFGVPYAANTEISGCSGCNHVFDGTLRLLTDDTPAGEDSSSVFIPVVTRRSDWRGDRGINNYNAACTDELGKTIKTYTFTLPEDVKGGRVVIMMSNHGAGTNGEEYVRRMHYASFDSAPVLEWKPGRTSCEPFRKYNTQLNGIYGFRPRSDASWQRNSNWCPGAPIPYQTFSTGAIPAGQHSVTIEVPEAEFYGADGYFPVSIYFQGDTEDETIFEPYDADSRPAGISAASADANSAEVSMADETVSVKCPAGIKSLQLYNSAGKLCANASFRTAPAAAAMHTDGLPCGIYLLMVDTPLGSETHRLIK